MPRPPFIWLLPVLFLIQDGSNAEPVQSDPNTTNSKDSRLDKAKQADLDRGGFSATDMPNMAIIPSRAPYYVYIKKKMTWFEARKVCQKLGGDLATFPSYKAFDYIDAAIEPVFEYIDTQHGQHGIWVGAIREGRTWKELDRGHWNWISGEHFPKDFNKWYNGAVGPNVLNYKGAFLTYSNYNKMYLNITKGYMKADFQSTLLHSLCQIY